MIKVTAIGSIDFHYQIKGALVAEEFALETLTKWDSEKIKDSDVLILTDQIADSFLKQKDHPELSCPIILFTHSTFPLHQIYDKAQQLKATGVISTENLEKLPILLQHTYQQSLSTRQQSVTKKHAVGVFSLKGGVGKSVLTYHLAAYLASLLPEQILLLDLAIPLGSSKSFLNSDSEKSWSVLRPLLKSDQGLTTQRIKSQTVSTAYHFDVLGAGKLLSETALSENEFERLLAIAREQHVVTLIDTSHLPLNEMVEWMKKMDTIIWLTTLDPSSMVQTISFWEEYEHLFESQQKMIICNQIEPDLDKTLLKSFQQKLKNYPFFVIDADAEAIKHHQQQFQLITDTELLLGKQFKDIAEAVFSQLT